MPAPNRSVKYLSLGLLRLFRMSTRRPKLVLALFVVATLGSASLIPGLKSILTINEMLDESFPALARIQEAKRLFGITPSAVVLFQPAGEQFTQGELCRIDDWVRSVRFHFKIVTSINSPFDVRAPHREGGKLWYPRVLPMLCTDPAQRDTPVSLDAFAANTFGGMLTGKAHDDLLIEISLDEVATATRKGRFDPSHLDAILASLNEDFPQGPGQTRTRLTGGAVVQHYYAAAMKADQRLNIATLVIILVLFRVFFGRWRGAFLMIVSLAMCGLIVNGLMSLFGSPIDLLSNLLFIVVAAASVEDFLFVSFLRQQAQKYTPAIFSRMIVPSFLTSLTTIIGFGALAFSDLPPIRRFGVWSAVGAGLEWAVIFLVFPCLMRYVPYLRDWAVPTRGFGASILGRVAQLRLPRIATACALLLAGASLYGMTTLEVDDGPKQTFPKDHPHTAALDYLGTSRGWESTFFVVFPPEATRDTVRSVVDGLAQSVNVTSVVDGYTHVERFTAGLPETSRQLVAGDFKSTELYDSYFSRTGEVRAMVFVEKSTLGAMRPLRERVAQLCAGKGCYAAGDLISYGELCDRIVKTFIEAIGISLGLIALMLVAVSWGIGWRRTTALVVSAMWGPLVSLGSYAWLGFDLNFVTTVFISVLVGLAGDNALQYLWANPRQGIAAGADELGVSSVQTAAIMGCCMLLFCFSSFNYPRVLGGAFAAAFALLLIGDLFLLRGLLASTAEPAADDEVATPQKLVHG